MLEKKKVEPGSFFKYQFHQVAIFTNHAAEAMAHWSQLGHDKWIEDRAVLVGDLEGKRVRTAAHMCFNYDIMPMELEFLEYVGPNRHDTEGRTGDQPFISHMSTYVENVFVEAMALRDNYGVLPYHRFVTTEHENPGVVGKKRFIECIYDTRRLLGYDVKLICKVPWDFPNDLWLDWDITKPHTAAEWDTTRMALEFPRSEGQKLKDSIAGTLVKDRPVNKHVDFNHPEFSEWEKQEDPGGDL